MSELGRQPKLLAFAGHFEALDRAGLAAVVRAELLALRENLGRGMIAISCVASGTDLVFLRACVELRIPAIVLLPFPENDFEDPAELELARHLTSVALAKYVLPARNLVEWADVLLLASDGSPTGEIADDARDLGIPTRLIHPTTLETCWLIPPDTSRNARHGFDTRQDLLDFLDGRFGGNSQAATSS